MNIKRFDNMSERHSLWRQNKFRSQWPIIHSPVSLPYTWKSNWWMSLILSGHATVWPSLWVPSRGSTVGFLLLQCSSGVVRHPRDLQVSVATHFCRVLIFASSKYLFVIYLFHVMIHWWVRKPPRGPNNCMFWAMIEAEGEVRRL